MVPVASELLVAPAAEGPAIVSITPERAGWKYVGFEALRLADGAEVTRETGDRELCVGVIAGPPRVGGWPVGARAAPCEGPPDAAYFPPGSTVTLRGEAEIGLCWAPAPDGG